MTHSRFAHAVSRSENGRRLDVVVANWLTRDLNRALSKSVVRRLIMAGAVRVNGRPVWRPGLLVDSGATLDAVIDGGKLQPASPAAMADPSALEILYEDDDIIAVAKPAGLVMHATADPGRQDFFNAVRRLLARRLPRPDGRDNALPYLGLHHRLDVETSGIVLFTKRERANRALAEQFERGEVTKIYHAIATTPRLPRRIGNFGGSRPLVTAAWRVENRLASTGRGRHARMDPVDTGGALAVTAFEILDDLGRALLIEARPETGRKHQIRAHLAAARMPILGDRRYSGAMDTDGCKAPRVMLHASRLIVRHPVTSEPLDLACPYPADFAGLIACLRRQAARRRSKPV